MFNKLTKPIDDFLNTITMYRLVLYYLLCLWVYAFILSFFHIFAFSPLGLLITGFMILTVCWAFNTLLRNFFKSITNLESVYITVLILCLIISPFKNLLDISFIILVSIVAIFSKYVFAFNKKHIFNPVAIAVFLPSLISLGSATWWVGTTWMMPLVLIGGILIVRKIKRYDLVFVFLLTSLTVILSSSFIRGFDLIESLKKTIFDSPLLFFAFVMLTEPLTTPPTKIYQSVYGLITGLLFFPNLHLGSFYTTPEISLLIGNIFSYFVSPKEKLMLILKEKIQLSPDSYDFIFDLNKKITFLPGQYLEWTLNFNKADSRGNRRYFTIASSPTENNLRIGIKFYEKASSFKNKLLSLDTGDKILAGSLSGDFTLPTYTNQKYVFMAGGIGITPFRSMLKYLIDKNIKIPITFFYSNKVEQDIIYKDVLEEAKEKLNINIIYTLTDLENIPEEWSGKRGRINEQMIRQEIFDYKERIFYLSGPRAMVNGFEETLRNMGIDNNKIITDYFPGFV